MRIAVWVLGSVVVAPFVAVAAGCGAPGAGESASSGAQAVTAPVCGAPSTGPVQGVDVSEFQGTFDWAAAKAGGAVFGYARISDGTGHVDATFPGNWSRMKAAGVLRGAYQFFEPGEDEVAQADMMVSDVGVLGDGDLPCMIDVEVAGGQSGATIEAKVKSWMDIVQKGTGKAPVIYTGAYFWEDNVGAAIPSTPLWVAAYGPSCPSLPTGWGSWAIWQYSDGNGNEDHDVFNGTLAQLQAMAGGSSPPPPPPPPPPAAWPDLPRRSRVDLDGDGRADVCGRSSAGLVCALASGAAFGAPVDGPAWSDALGWAKPEYFGTIQHGDINGDGKSDVCARAAAGVVCEVSAGASFGQEIKGPAWSDAAGWAQAPYYATIQLGDVNGDGKADLCGRSPAGVECAFATGTGFAAPVQGPAWSDASGWGAPQYYATIQLADVNGDGKADVCARAAAGIVCAPSDGHGFGAEVAGPAWKDADGWGAAPYGSTVRFPDVNGDGKADVCARRAAGIVCALSDGHGFGPEIAGPAWSDAAGWGVAARYETIRFADVNGDGKSDVCGRGASAMVCALSTGTGFSGEVKGPAWSDAAGWSAPEYYTTIGAGDVNGDGADDLCARSAAGVECALAGGGGFGPATVAGPAWSDKAGWSAAASYATIRLLGVPRRAGGSPSPSGGSAGADGGAAATSDAGRAPGGGWGASGDAEASGSAGAGGGCATAPGYGARGEAIGAFAFAGLALVRRRRRRAG